MALVINDRVKETSTTTGTGTFDLGGAVTGFETFVAGIADGNTTYYAIFLQGSTEWEVGLGTVTDATPDTLARTTVITSSNSDSAVNFSAGTKDVFCTLPASKAVYLDASGDPVPAQISFKEAGTNFTGSLLVGHSTTGTLNAATYNTGVGLTALDAITEGDQNDALGYGALGALTTGNFNTGIGVTTLTTLSTGTRNTAVGTASLRDLSGDDNTAVGYWTGYEQAGGDKNTVVGSYALNGVTGQSSSNNTAIGYEALKVVTTGDGNISLGYQSGNNITSGSGNVVIGNADVPTATADDQLSISDGEDGAVVWLTGDSSGTVSANGGELTTTGKAFVMGF